jgi:hypothetical protein
VVRNVPPRPYRRWMTTRTCHRCRIQSVSGRVRLVPMNPDKPERHQALCDGCMGLLAEEITAGRTQWRAMVDLPLED